MPTTDEKTTKSEEKKLERPIPDERIVILSLDYDSCAEVLCDAKKWGPARVETLRKSLAQNIKNASKKVELYVGSSRQDGDTDYYNSKYNRNPRCFSAFKKLCEMNGWHLQRLLYPDAHYGWERGETMTANEKSDDSRACGPKYSAYSNLFDATKLKVIQAQLDDVAMNHPNRKIDFYFYDDRSDILKILQRRLIVPPGITVHLIRYDAIPNKLENVAVLKGIEDYIEIIRKKADSLPEGTKKTAALNLANNMTTLLRTYESTSMKPLEFKRQALTHINEARKSLAEHRGWGEVIANLAVFVFGIWPRLFTCGINYWMARNFLLFRTDSETKMDNMRNAVNSHVEHTATAKLVKEHLRKK